jgi:hypothetical protein
MIFLGKGPGLHIQRSWLPHKKKMNLDVKYRQPLKKSMSTRT